MDDRTPSNETRGLALSVLLFAVILQGPACTSGTPEITIKEQKAALSPMIVGSGSVFMEVVNSGSGDDTLVRARTDIADTIVELHDVKDGRMIKKERLPIPAKSTVQLQPGGLHVMIFNMPKTVKDGHAFTMTLVFEKSGEKTIPLQFSPAMNLHHH